VSESDPRKIPEVRAMMHAAMHQAQAYAELMWHIRQLYGVTSVLAEMQHKNPALTDSQRRRCNRIAMGMKDVKRRIERDLDGGNVLYLDRASEKYSKWLDEEDGAAGG